MVWKVVNSAPHKLVRPVTDGEHNLENTLVVSLHLLHDVDVLGNKVLVGVDSLNLDSICGTLVPVVFSPAMLTFGVLLRLQCWEGLCDQQEFRLSPPAAAPDNASKDHLRDLIQDLFLHGDEGVVLAGSDIAVKSQLLELMCAERVVEAEGPPWKLSALGRRRLRACQWVGKRKPVFQACEAPSLDSTLSQLLLYMRDGGWQYKAADKETLWCVGG